MSRIGREPIVVPAGIDVTIGDNNVVTVKGPLGTLTQEFSTAMSITRDGDKITVARPNDEKEMRALHGLTRTLINNMIVGVKEGYQKKLQIVGVGYRVAKQGNKLVMNLGYSHDVVFEEGDGVTFDAPDANTIIVKSADKQKCGQVAAKIRAKRPPEPYHGKGVKYENEVIRRKSGKAGK
ncbi:MAG: 50S ribosomal protein L6 [Clostridia bacterium]|nr:50S ribosomal protein L6 [Clostridia bacterium]